MGASCVCGAPCEQNSWTDLKSRLQQSAKERRNSRCHCASRRPKWLRIRRRTGKKKVSFEGCTCDPHICCPAMHPEYELSPTPKKVCRFTVDAYFA